MVYSHEHITVDLSGPKCDVDCNLNDMDGTVEELRQLKMLGVTHIIDVTNRGMGRNVDYCRQVSEKTGIEILLSTGYYKEPFLPQEVYEKSEHELCEIMVTEITEGIDGTATKARVIGEIGTSKNSIEPMERKVLTAGAMAHKLTGLPIVTHTTLGLLGMEQIELFRSLGVDTTNIVISHVDLSGDIEYMVRLLDTGVNVAFDTVGKNNYQPDENRLEWLTKLCEKGYSKQILLSMDITRKSHLKKNGGLGYAYLLESFVPQISNQGYKNDMLIHNPKRIFSL